MVVSNSFEQTLASARAFRSSRDRGGPRAQARAPQRLRHLQDRHRTFEHTHRGPDASRQNGDDAATTLAVLHDYRRWVAGADDDGAGMEHKLGLTCDPIGGGLAVNIIEC